MGGRGSAGTRKPTAAPKRKSLFSKDSSEKPAKRAKDSLKKQPVTGKQVQQDFIDYVKQHINIDLDRVRDAQFDNRSGFNILVNKWSHKTEKGALDINKWRELYSLASKSSKFEVRFEDNGAERTFVRVKRKR